MVHVMPAPHSGASYSNRQSLRPPRPIRDRRGWVVGCLRVYRGRLVLFCAVDERIHRLRRPAAWAKDQGALDAARRAGAVEVLLYDKNAAKRWTAPLAAFDEHGFRLDYGHGNQVALPLERWTVEDLRGPVQCVLFAAAGVPA